MPTKKKTADALEYAQLKARVLTLETNAMRTEALLHQLVIRCEDLTAKMQATSDVMHQALKRLENPQPVQSARMVEVTVSLPETAIHQLIAEQVAGRTARDPSIVSIREQELLRAGKKIDAIKEYRGRTGTPLKESKDAVEDWMRKNGVPDPFYPHP